MLQWLPTFFIRSHGLSLTQVGLYVGAAKGGVGVLGTVLGGLVLTRIGPRDPRWELWWPMAIFALTPLFTLASLAVADWRLALGLQIVEALIGSAAGGVALSAVQTYVEPFRRATALAVLLLLSSLLGLGLGPVAVGVVSDLLAPRLGADSLRYALMGIGCMPLFGAVLLWRAARSAQGWRFPTEAVLPVWALRREIGEPSCRGPTLPERRPRDRGRRGRAARWFAGAAAARRRPNRGAWARAAAEGARRGLPHDQRRPARTRRQRLVAGRGLQPGRPRLRHCGGARGAVEPAFLVGASSAARPASATPGRAVRWRVWSWSTRPQWWRRPA